MIGDAIMKKRFLPVLLSALVLLVFSAGCSNEIDNAVNLLGGTEEQQEEARDIISMSVKDPLPKLEKALTNKKLSPLARKNVALLIGAQGSKMGDESVVPVLVDAIDDSEPEVQLAIVDALESVGEDSSLAAIQKLAGHKSATVAQRAQSILNSEAQKFIDEANALADKAIDRKIELLNEALGVDPNNSEVLLRLAGYYTLNGEKQKARDIYERGGKYVREVMVLGPIYGRVKGTLVAPGAVDTSKPVEYEGAEYRWLKFDTVADRGVIDFRRMRETKVSKGTSLVTFTIDSESKQDVLLKLYSKSSVDMWLNGKEIFRANPKQIRAKDEHPVEITLNEGENRVLMKLLDKMYPRFSIRVSGPGGEKIDTISYGL